MRGIRFVAVVALAVGVVAISSFAQTWVSKGMTGNKIACITVDDSGRVLAGATEVMKAGVRDDRLFVGADRTNSSFTLVPSSIAMDVRAITRSNSGKFNPIQYLAVGLEWNNNLSIPRGFIMNGLGSSPFYSTSGTSTLSGASAIAVRVTSGSTRDTAQVFVGSGTTIGQGLLRYGSVSLDTIKKIPANPFGATKPFCAAMAIFGSDRKCFAGGYDTSGAGSGNLLREVTPDSMTIVKGDIKVTALFAGSKYLYVGTKDDGLYRYEEPATAGGAGVWTHAAGPANEPITSIAAVATSSTDDVVYVAVSSGVYKTLSSQNVAWTKLGTLASPRNLALGTTRGDLYAGTNNGVWYIADPVAGVAQPAMRGRVAGSSVQYVATTRSIDFQVFAASGADVTVALFDFSGKQIAAKSASAGSVSFDRPRGPCLYQLKGGNRTLVSGMVMAR